jgi:hypothetical protein
MRLGFIFGLFLASERIRELRAFMNICRLGYFPRARVLLLTSSAMPFHRLLEGRSVSGSARRTSEVYCTCNHLLAEAWNLTMGFTFVIKLPRRLRRCFRSSLPCLRKLTAASAIRRSHAGDALEAVLGTA